MPFTFFFYDTVSFPWDLQYPEDLHYCFRGPAFSPPEPALSLPGPALLLPDLHFDFQDLHYHF